MAGEETKTIGRLLKVAKSTPSENQEGVAAQIKFAALAKYEVNVRSFHPNRQFERKGFRFHGDNRGFSLGESWVGGDDSKGRPTSRIWQRYILDTNLMVTGALTKSTDSNLEQASNPSDSGPGLWSIFGSREDYKKKEFQPHGTLVVTQVNTPHGGQKELRTKSWYGGINFAFLMSKPIEKVIGTTPVPSLDVFNEIWIKVERVNLYMDILSLTYGDGFPNCESFVKDPAGNTLFLGSHVRIGDPSTHLWNVNKRLMWANTIRIEIDEKGNFGQKLWVFGQVLGGSPSLRELYPTSGEDETCMIASGDMKSDVSKKTWGKFEWNCGDPTQITQPEKGSTLPLYLSAYQTPLDVLSGLLDATWKIGPRNKTTRDDWNNYHLHRNPNEGRTKDDYDLADEKWKLKKQ
ncbi:hypothetical protein [Collimonas fungivorans]|nr:hypothetical protein [Collimonas fungivorans]